MPHSRPMSSVAVLQPLYTLEQSLNEALYRGEGYRHIQPSLDALTAYVSGTLHGAYQQLLAFGIDAPEWVGAHYQQMVDQTREWVAEYHDGAPILAAEIVHFLRGWLSEHRLWCGASPFANHERAHLPTPLAALS